MTDKRPKCKDCGQQHRIGAEHSAAYYLAVSGRTVVLHPREAEALGVYDLPNLPGNRDVTKVGGRPRLIESDFRDESKPAATLKRRSRRAVQSAIERGDITRQPCVVCGTSENVQAHHQDHSRPFDVQWLCLTHHREADGVTTKARTISSRHIGRPPIGERAMTATERKRRERARQR